MDALPISKRRFCQKHLGVLFIWSIWRNVQRGFSQSLPKQGISEFLPCSQPPGRRQSGAEGAATYSVHHVLSEAERSTKYQDTASRLPLFPSAGHVHFCVQHTPYKCQHFPSHAESWQGTSAFFRKPHSETPYHQVGFLLFKWDIALSQSQYPPELSPFKSPSPMVEELQLPQELMARRQTALQEPDSKPSSLKLMSAPWNPLQNQRRPQTCTAAS